MQVKVRAVGRDSFWSAGRKWTQEGRVVGLVANDETPVKFYKPGTTEFNFPSVDGEYQAWIVGNRVKHDQRDEITENDYAQIRADYRFLAVEFPDPPKFEPAPAPAPQQAKR